MNIANGNPDWILEHGAQESRTWTSDIVKTSQDKGVLTSLINAGYVYHQHDGQDSTVELTEKGLDILKTFYH